MIYYSRFLKEREINLIKSNPKWLYEMQLLFYGNVYIGIDHKGIFATNGNCLNNKVYYKKNINRR